MNRHAVYHKPESCFAYATAADALTVTLRLAAEDKPDAAEILYGNKYDFPEKRFTASMRLYACDGTFAYYRAYLRLPDARCAYIFRITENGKTYYYSEEGLSEEYAFDLSYYTFFQFPFINAADIMPAVDWTAHAVFYQIFIDRFARGDFEKDDGYINTPWGGKIDRHSFAGGDLQGITDGLPYLKDLGVTALYLTPVFLSPSNHKYNVTDYLKVDPQFGGNAKLKALLDAAHALDMKVVVDAVFNHCDAAHPRFADVAERGRASAYYNCFMIDGDRPDPAKGNYAHFAHCRRMPKWNTNDKETRRYLTDIALKYLAAGFDGLRLDVADELSRVMLRQLRREVKEKYPQALILGEVWHDPSPWLQGDMLDGVMNYKLQKILTDFFATARIDAETAANRMNGLLVSSAAQANAMALNFVDTHDTPRFLRSAGGNENALLCALCAAVMFTGMPCVYYGTELPLDGGGDPDCRRTFDRAIAGRDKEYFKSFKQILGLKKQTALGGADAQVSCERGLLKITRAHGGESVTAYFNARGGAKALRADGETLLRINFNGKKISGGGAAVVKNKI